MHKCKPFTQTLMHSWTMPRALAQSTGWDEATLSQSIQKHRRRRGNDVVFVVLDVYKKKLEKGSEVKTRWMCPSQQHVGAFLCLLRAKMQLPAHEAMQVSFGGGGMVPLNTPMSQVQVRFGEVTPSGAPLVRCHVVAESTFGEK